VPKSPLEFWPPQTTISVPVQIAVWLERPAGTFTVEVGCQVSVAGLYRPPVLEEKPPHTTISLPVQTAVLHTRGDGAFVVEVEVQLSVTGSYRPPVSRPAGVPS